MSIQTTGVRMFVRNPNQNKTYLFLNKTSVLLTRFPLMLIVVVSLVQLITIEKASAQFKFHPGHYIQPLGGDKTVDGYLMKQDYTIMESSPVFVGLQIPLKWADLESSKGVYTFKIIEDHLAKMKNTGSKKKRLAILFLTRTTNLDDPFIPNYLKTSEYEGGTYKYTNELNGGSLSVHKGNGIKLWNTNVRDRLVKLMQQLGTKFNSHTHFEGIGFGETAVGIPFQFTLTDAQEANTHKNYLYVHTQMRSYFPNTMIFQFTNYPREILESFIMTGTNALYKNNVALGGPDVWLNDPGVNIEGNPNTPDGVYSYYKKYSGYLPLTPSVQSGNYKCSRADCKNDKGNFVPTVRQLLDFSRDKLKANYIFWTHTDQAGKFDQVVNMLKNLYSSSSDTDKQAVKLKTTCPSKYGVCTSD